MGTNTITSVSDGQTAVASQLNQYKTILGGDIVPRNTSGVPVDEAGSLGDSNYTFEKVRFGGSSNGLYLTNDSSDLSINVDDSQVSAIDQYGFYKQERTVVTSTASAIALDQGAIANVTLSKSGTIPTGSGYYYLGLSFTANTLTTVDARLNLCIKINSRTGTYYFQLYLNSTSSPDFSFNTNFAGTDIMYYQSIPCSFISSTSPATFYLMGKREGMSIPYTINMDVVAYCDYV